MMLAMCYHCGKRRMVNLSTMRGPARQYCADCWEVLNLPEDKPPPWGKPSTLSPSASFDNAVRAYDEDR